VPIDYSLKEKTEELLRLFEDRFRVIKRNPNFSRIIYQLDKEGSIKLAKELFGVGEHKAIGIDGSMIQEEALEMLLFHVSAIGYSAPFVVNENDIFFDFKRMKKEEELSVSSSIPLWLEDLPNVAITKSGLVDIAEAGSEITFSIMLMSELWIALRAIEEGAKIVFMDRPISGAYQTLSREVRRFLMHMENTALEELFGKEVKGYVFLLLLLGPKGSHVPKRRPYLLHQAVDKIKDEPKGVSELASLLDLDDTGLKRLMKRITEFENRYGVFDLGYNYVGLKIKDYREKASRYAKELVNKLFWGKGHPFRVGDKWLTTPEINTINFILLQEILELVKERKALLIGIAKDTNTSEYTRSVLPLLIDLNVVDGSLKPRVKHDRVYLTMVSSGNMDVAVPPWRCLGYDACFATLVKDEVSESYKAARKVVSRERLFVRGYFQSRASEVYRSPIFFYDRPYIDEFDSEHLTEVEFEERGGKSKAKVYLETKPNPLDNLILHILSISDNPEVFEAYGHNMLLYMADKAVKAESELAKGLLKGLVSLKLTPLARRERLFSIIRRFRETRSEMEQARREVKS